MSATQEDLRGVRGVAAIGRFLLELVGLGALVYWGLQAGSDDIGRAVLGLLVAGGLIVAWAVVVAPKARNRLSQRVRLWIGSGLLLLSALALWTVGSSVAAAAFAGLILIDTLVLDRTAA
jgi:hypothetical protein